MYENGIAMATAHTLLNLSAFVLMLLQTWHVLATDQCTNFPSLAPSDTSPSQGQNLTLTCTVSNSSSSMSSSANITWFYNETNPGNTGVSLSSLGDQRFSISQDVLEGCVRSIFHVASVVSEDSGAYWCHDGSNSSAAVIIDVLVPFDLSYPVCTVNGDQDVLAEVGERIDLSCVAPVSHPSWVLVWQKTSPAATIPATISTESGFDVLSATLKLTAEYHKSVLGCYAYEDGGLGAGRSNCQLGTFYVVDSPLVDQFSIDPVDPVRNPGVDVIFVCTAVKGFGSKGPKAAFIVDGNTSLTAVPFSDGEAAMLTGISESDNQTTIGCGLFFKGKLYRAKYSTISVIKPPPTTVTNRPITTTPDNTYHTDITTEVVTSIETVAESPPTALSTDKTTTTPDTVYHTDIMTELVTSVETRETELTSSGTNTADLLATPELLTSSSLITTVNDIESSTHIDDSSIDTITEFVTGTERSDSTSETYSITAYDSTTFPAETSTPVYQ